MSQINIKFNIILPLEVVGENANSIFRLKDKSYYDHNYYELPTYGDWISYGDSNNNILLEEYDECSNCYTYTFGRFEDGKFIRVLGFATDDTCLNKVNIINK